MGVMNSLTAYKLGQHAGLIMRFWAPGKRWKVNLNVDFSALWNGEDIGKSTV